MTDTVAPDKSKYPDSLGGCPPGTHYWPGTLDLRKIGKIQGECIVDGPKPECGANAILRPVGGPLAHSDRSKPFLWVCEECPEGTAKQAVERFFYAEGPPTKFECAYPVAPRPYTYRDFMRSNADLFGYLFPILIAAVAFALIIMTINRRP